MAAPADVQKFIDAHNAKYDALHKKFEDNFWATRMDLKGNSGDELTRTKAEYEAFLRDKENLAAVRAQMGAASPDQKRVLEVMERTHKCYLIESDEGAALKEKIIDLESQLEELRNKMKLGYTDPSTGEFQEASTVQLISKMASSDDEAMRKACYEGYCSVGPFIAERFAEILRLRVRLAKLVGGGGTFYDWKCQQAEGFDTKRLFEILDDLERQSRPLLSAAEERLKKEKGESALKPWNRRYMISGSVTKQRDPYFQFSTAVDSWARSFAALGINYKDSVMNLDLCDRKNKYSNGFCHWPQCAYTKPDGTWQPSVANFTSLATPNQVGSGHDALATLMHEGGHAAHFANIVQPSPFFVQERPPMSAAYAENQSMFLDSLVTDAAWMGRYAKDEKGEVIPWDIVAQGVKCAHPYAVFPLRSMLAVCYFEKALYEMSEEELTAERIQEVADEVEQKIKGPGMKGMLLTIPHIISDEASCYYQGYVLAEMSVYQTRAHFLKKYGRIVDNENVGKDLAEVYWRPGNSECFLDLVEKLTGRPLTADDWIEKLGVSVEERLAGEERDYQEAVKAGPKFAPGADFDLGMQMRLVHGDEVIADSGRDGSIAKCCAMFRDWLPKEFPPSA
eukprot:TRINITY_DN13013_c0_g1_i1.p1 TRINITY_DN13013_c0_g1~~TRINITY_DN13013_c0_g1_i1.p1  ORF type:complete len:663 (+),score=219.50 TRINITY_DN13013_c0_g1_i1:126-1991(+)